MQHETEHPARVKFCQQAEIWLDPITTSEISVTTATLASLLTLLKRTDAVI